MNFNEMADVIERFLNGTAGPWEWDDVFQGGTYEDPFLRSIQKRCLELDREFPPVVKGWYSSPEGLSVLRELVAALRSRSGEEQSGIA